MAYTITFGSAMPVDEYLRGNVRMYVAEDGRMFVGHDTTDMLHACNMECVVEVLMECEERWEGIDMHTYVAPDEPDNRGYVPTADISSADYGDDTYVLCAACDAELHRDDERHEAEYGHRIGE